MSWNLKWEGRATNYVPDLLRTTGRPGRMAHVAREAIWEAVQGIGEHNHDAYARVQANGWEDAQQPGLGQFNLAIAVIPEPGEIATKLRDQQPVSLHSRSGDVTPADSGPASSA